MPLVYLSDQRLQRPRGTTEPRAHDQLTWPTTEGLNVALNLAIMRASSHTGKDAWLRQGTAVLLREADVVFERVTPSLRGFPILPPLGHGNGGLVRPFREDHTAGRIRRAPLNH